MAQPKLIYSSQSWADLSKSGGKLAGYASNTDEFYRSVVFTTDGYIVTHGTVFKTSVGTDAAVTGSVANNTFTLGGNASGSVTIEGGTKLTASTNGTTITIDHEDATTGTSNSVGPTAASSDSIDVPLIYRDTQGHITTSSTTYTATLNKLKTTALDASKTMYLVGKETAANTDEGKTKTSIYVTTDVSGVATLYTPKLELANGAAGVTLKDSTNGDKTLAKYIEDAVNDAKTQAMTFKGTFTATSTASVPAGSPVNGDTYKVSSAGKVTLKTGTIADVKPGDVLIAKVTTSGQTTTTEWILVPAADEIETFISIATSDLTWSNTSKQSGSLTLGNAALKAIANTSTFTSSTSGLVTGAEVKAWVESLNYSTTTGTVTSVGVDTTKKSGLLIASAAGGTFGETAQSATAVYRTALVDYTNNDASATKTGTRLYAVQLDKDGKLAVNVPQVYSLITTTSATSTTGTAINAAASQSVFVNILDGATSTKSVVGSLELATGAGLQIAATNDGKITLTPVLPSAAHGTFTTSPETYGYTVGSVTINGNTTTFYGRDTNTWRPINYQGIKTAYIANTTDAILETKSAGSNTIVFGTSFLSTSNTTNKTETIDIAWAEIDASGKINYVV